MNFFNKNDRLLIIAAHPDDEVLGCGGTILLAKSLGAHISLVCLGEGVSSRYNNKLNQNLKAHKIRTKEFLNCIEILGVDYYKLEERLCNQFDTIPLLTIVQSLEKIISQIKPNIIFTHNPFEVNVDHIITYRAVEVATRPTKNKSIDKVFSFEIPCSGNWTFNKGFVPNTYVDIYKFWSKKIKAWQCYKNETKPYPFPRSDKAIKSIAEYRGIQAGLKLAEAFKLERHIYNS